MNSSFYNYFTARRIKNYISGFLISISSDDHHRMFEFNINTTMLINTEKNVSFLALDTVFLVKLLFLYRKKLKFVFKFH